MTPQELKNTILQLAIQGKLVEQRPEEGTAEELYRQIQAEKQALIKSGKIKKEKHLPEISDDEKPFDIPESWKWVRLNSTIFLLSGSDLPPNKYNSSQKGIPYITGASNIENGNVIINRWTESPNNIAVKGNLLLTCKGTVGKTAILDVGEVHIARQIMAVTPIVVDTVFIKYYIESQVPSLKSQAKSMIPGIERNSVLNLLVPLPPLGEQKRIVAKIEELLPLVDKYEAAWSALNALNKRFPDDLQKSLLQLAIQGKLVEQRPEEGTAEELYRQIQKEKQALIKAGKIKKDKPLPEITDDEKPFDIPESWKWVRLGDIGSWASGATPSRTNPDFYRGNIPWLKTGDLNDGHVSKVPEHITEEALQKTSIRLNPVGSVLMAMYGATIGKLAILDVPMTTNQACCACITPKRVYNEFLFYFLLGYRKSFVKMGEGGAQPNISKEKIISTLFPLPPLGEQKRIVAKLKELLPLCERLKQSDLTSVSATRN